MPIQFLVDYEHDMLTKIQELIGVYLQQDEEWLHQEHRRKFAHRWPFLL
jgi:hypothetical protein